MCPDEVLLYFYINELYWSPVMYNILPNASVMLFFFYFVFKSVGKRLCGSHGWSLVTRQTMTPASRLLHFCLHTALHINAVECKSMSAVGNAHVAVLLPLLWCRLVLLWCRSLLWWNHGAWKRVRLCAAMTPHQQSGLLACFRSLRLILLSRVPEVVLVTWHTVCSAHLSVHKCPLPL